MTAEEKYELVCRCQRFLRRHGEGGKSFDPERRDAYIRSNVVVCETGRNGLNPHLRLMVYRPGGERWGTIFVKTVLSTKWGPIEVPRELLEELRQAMVLDDLVDS